MSQLPKNPRQIVFLEQTTKIVIFTQHFVENKKPAFLLEVIIYFSFTWDFFQVFKKKEQKFLVEIGLTASVEVDLWFDPETTG